MQSRMLAWIKDPSYTLQDFFPRDRDGDEIRHRNRAREKDRQRHEERKEAQAPEPGEVFHVLNDNDCASDDVWRAEAENQAGLRFVDFYGTYTTETEDK